MFYPLSTACSGVGLSREVQISLNQTTLSSFSERIPRCSKVSQETKELIYQDPRYRELNCVQTEKIAVPVGVLPKITKIACTTDNKCKKGCGLLSHFTTQSSNNSAITIINDNAILRISVTQLT